MNKISAYTILFHDLEFYEDVIDNVYEHVDEIVIVDGPYSYAIETLKKFNFFYDETSKPKELERIINKYPKIRYYYKIFENEEQKRMEGYNLCQNNLVLLLDTDEFINLSPDKIDRFVKNKNKFVCPGKIYNMCDYNVNFEKMVEKMILFKKNKITALHHLDYLWLVNCQQGKIITEYISSEDFGLIYHFTLNRSKKYNLIKYIFYVLLYRNKNNMSYDLIDIYSNEKLLEYLTIPEILNIFIHSHYNRINIPHDNGILEQIPDNPLILKLKKYQNKMDYFVVPNMKCLRNIPTNFLLPLNSHEIILDFENVKDIEINVIHLYFNHKPIRNSYQKSNLDYNQIKIPNLKSSSLDEKLLKYIYIELVVRQTRNQDFIWILKNIT